MFTSTNVGLHTINPSLNRTLTIDLDCERYCFKFKTNLLDEKTTQNSITNRFGFKVIDLNNFKHMKPNGKNYW